MNDIHLDSAILLKIVRYRLHKLIRHLLRTHLCRDCQGVTKSKSPSNSQLIATETAHRRSSEMGSTAKLAALAMNTIAFTDTEGREPIRKQF